jgi:hypothetical protein
MKFERMARPKSEFAAGAPSASSLDSRLETQRLDHATINLLLFLL